MTTLESLDAKYAILGTKNSNEIFLVTFKNCKHLVTSLCF